MSKPHSRKRVSTRLIHLSSLGTCWRQHVRQRLSIMPSCQCKHLCMSLLMRLRSSKGNGERVGMTHHLQVKTKGHLSHQTQITMGDQQQILTYLGCLSQHSTNFRRQENTLFSPTSLSVHIQPPLTFIP